MTEMPILDAFRTEIVEHALIMPFAIAGGGMESARAVITTVRLSDGTEGIGESAPFPAVSGETVESTTADLQTLQAVLNRLAPAERIPFIESDQLLSLLPHAPAARCGIELALLDARLKSRGESLAEWMPPSRDSITTDITLPVGPTQNALAFVADVVAKGFQTLKVKIGGRSLQEDVELLIAIHDAFPSLELILDANCAYDYDASRRLLASLEKANVPVPLLEQPMPRESLADLARLQESTDVIICLDESLKSVADLDSIAAFPALRSVNFKTMKMGLLPTLTAVERAAERGMVCMIGGMVESRLSMTVSAAIAMHYPETIRFVDLDTPLFMLPGPIEGGMAYDGPVVSVPAGGAGHGCTLRAG